MDIQALIAFQAVAKAGSISQAARELNYAQSNMTAKIQQLENELQAPLFYRHNRGTTLTAKGQLLLQYTERILRLIEDTIQAIKDDNVPAGPLLLGAMETTAAIRLPSLLSTYHSNYPDVDLTLTTGPTKQHVQAVLHYELDGAFVAGPIDHPDLSQRVVFSEELVLITNTKHPPLTSIQDIQTRTLLVFRSGCSYRAYLEQWLHEEGVFQYRTMEFGALDAILGCVSAGLGISMLPYSVVEKQVKANTLRLHPLPNRFTKVETVFIHRKDKFMPTALAKFMEMFDHIAH